MIIVDNQYLGERGVDHERFCHTNTYDHGERPTIMSNTIITIKKQQKRDTDKCHNGDTKGMEMMIRKGVRKRIAYIQ
jgi:hypothetical protein